MNMYAKFLLHPPYDFWGEDFLIFFWKIYPLYCHGNQSNSAIWTKLIRITEDYSRNISLKKNLKICSETAKMPIFTFPIIKVPRMFLCRRLFTWSRWLSSCQRHGQGESMTRGLDPLSLGGNGGPPPENFEFLECRRSNGALLRSFINNILHWNGSFFIFLHDIFYLSS